MLANSQLTATLGQFNVKASKYSAGKYTLKVVQLNKYWVNSKLVQSPQFTVLSQPANYADESVLKVLAEPKNEAGSVSISYEIAPKYHGKVTFTVVTADAGAIVAEYTDVKPRGRFNKIDNSVRSISIAASG